LRRSISVTWTATRRRYCATFSPPNPPPTTTTRCTAGAFSAGGVIMASSILYARRRRDCKSVGRDLQSPYSGKAGPTSFPNAHLYDDSGMLDEVNGEPGEATGTFYSYCKVKCPFSIETFCNSVRLHQTRRTVCNTIAKRRLRTNILRGRIEREAMPATLLNTLNTMTCKSCDGTGNIPTTAFIPCPACQRSGRVLSVICSTCFGSGQTLVNSVEACPRCGGLSRQISS
jgi:hypothetical protein